MIWTHEKTERLKAIFRNHTAKELAVIFGTTERAIYQKCFYLGLKKGKDHARTRLSDSDKIWLRLNFPNMRNELCAMRLNISRRTVVRIARELGIEKSPQFMKETQAFSARKAKECHLKNGTYPAKGWYSPNLQKGALYHFKRKNQDNGNQD